MAKRKSKSESESGMIRTALFVEKSDMAQAVTLCENSGMPVAEIMRRALKEYLAKRRADINVRK
jgi:type III secretory pathway lipoprotein EscJ